jgi:flagellar biosynthetic protein FliO
MGGIAQTCLLLQSQPESPSGLGFGMALLKMVAALVLVCVLAYVGLRLARRHLPGAQPGGGLLRVVERCPLSARQSLWIVEVGERYLLIGASDGGLTRLAELDPEEVARRIKQGGPPPRSFLDLLRGKRG